MNRKIFDIDGEEIGYIKSKESIEKDVRESIEEGAKDFFTLINPQICENFIQILVGHMKDQWDIVELTALVHGHRIGTKEEIEATQEEMNAIKKAFKGE